MGFICNFHKRSQSCVLDGIALYDCFILHMNLLDVKGNAWAYTVLSLSFLWTNQNLDLRLRNTVVALFLRWLLYPN